MDNLNKSGIQPIGDLVLVRLEKKEVVTKGGLIIPETEESRRRQLGNVKTTLVAKGDYAFRNMKDAPEVGDKVIVVRYAGLLLEGSLEDEEGEYRLCRDDEVLARVINEVNHV